MASPDLALTAKLVFDPVSKRDYFNIGTQSLQFFIHFTGLRSGSTFCARSVPGQRIFAIGTEVSAQIALFLWSFSRNKYNEDLLTWPWPGAK